MCMKMIRWRRRRNESVENYGQQSAPFEITELAEGNCVNTEEQVQKWTAVVSGSRPRFLAKTMMLPDADIDRLAFNTLLAILPCMPLFVVRTFLL